MNSDDYRVESCEDEPLTIRIVEKSTGQVVGKSVGLVATMFNSKRATEKEVIEDFIIAKMKRGEYK